MMKRIACALLGGITCAATAEVSSQERAALPPIKDATARGRRPDMVEGPMERRETELLRLAPKEGPLERAREIRYDLGFARQVVGLDLVAPKDGLPMVVDVYGDGDVPVAKGVVLPRVEAGQVFTFGVKGTMTKTLTIRILGAEGGIAAMRVRVPSFAGHLLLRE